MKRQEIMWNTLVKGFSFFFLTLLFFKTTFSQSQSNNHNLLLSMGLEKPNLVGKTQFLLPEAYNAFLKMSMKAKNEGIQLFIVSGYRSFEDQKSIWNRKFEKYKKEGIHDSIILAKMTEYSSIPGTSRHHWGTDFDWVDLAGGLKKNPLQDSNYIKGGKYAKAYNWMLANASEFGFYEVYNNNKKRLGFHYEPWHFTYLPLSKIKIQNLSALPVYQLLLKKDIRGIHLINQIYFESYIQKYLFGISDKIK